MRRRKGPAPIPAWVTGAQLRKAQYAYIEAAGGAAEASNASFEIGDPDLATSLNEFSKMMMALSDRCMEAAFDAMTDDVPSPTRQLAGQALGPREQTLPDLG